MPSLKLVQESKVFMHYIRRIFKRSESSNFIHYYEKALNISDICKKLKYSTINSTFIGDLEYLLKRNLIVPV